jgi:hypothetical protein
MPLVITSRPCATIAVRLKRKSLMSGLIEAIYIAPQSGKPMQLVPRADLRHHRHPRTPRADHADLGRRHRAVSPPDRPAHRPGRPAPQCRDTGHRTERTGRPRIHPGQRGHLRRRTVRTVRHPRPAPVYHRGVPGRGRGGIHPSSRATRANRVRKYGSAGRPRRPLTTLFTRVELRFASLRRRRLLLIDALDAAATAGPKYGCVVGGLIAR